MMIESIINLLSCNHAYLQRFFLATIPQKLVACISDMQELYGIDIASSVNVVDSLDEFVC